MKKKRNQLSVKVRCTTKTKTTDVVQRPLFCFANESASMETQNTHNTHKDYKDVPNTFCSMSLFIVIHILFHLDKTSSDELKRHKTEKGNKPKM